MYTIFLIDISLKIRLYRSKSKSNMVNLTWGRLATRGAFEKRVLNVIRTHRARCRSTGTAVEIKRHRVAPWLSWQSGRFRYRRAETTRARVTLTMSVRHNIYIYVYICTNIGTLYVRVVRAGITLLSLLLRISIYCAGYCLRVCPPGFRILMIIMSTRYRPNRVKSNWSPVWTGIIIYRCIIYHDLYTACQIGFTSQGKNISRLQIFQNNSA